jgi:hypothetical protein
MRIMALVLALVSLVGHVSAGEPTKVTFTKESMGKLPPSWKADLTGPATTKVGSIWKIIADSTSPSKSGFVLAQTGESTGPYFNLCILENVKAKDVEISVHFKANKGEVDQGGGIVWRYQDAKNYYVARMNPLEDNYRLYKVVDGKRIQLASEGKIKVEANTWHLLTIKHVGKKIECSFDGKKSLSAEDDTISNAGRAGLWTKADAQTSFDLFSLRPLTENEK